jgi:hypothetical protein
MNFIRLILVAIFVSSASAEIGEITNGKVINVSARGMAGGGENSLIVGVVVQNAPRFLLVRALGPTLEQYGVVGFAQTPSFRVHNGTGGIVAEGRFWGQLNAEEQENMKSIFARLGAAPLKDGSSDSVAYVLLPAGAYTIVANAVGGDTSVILAEAYIDPQEVTLNRP